MPVTQTETTTETQAAAALPTVKSGRRSEAVQRLQIGLFGLAAMLLIVALANIIMERAKESEASTVSPVSADAPTINIPPPQIPANDPLVDAGVVPDMPVAAQPANPSAPPAGAPAAGNRGNGQQKQQ